MTSTSGAANMYTHQLTALWDTGSQCDYLITLGLQKPSAGPIKTDSNRTSGCRTAIWVNVKETENCLHFISEGDSLLMYEILTIYEDPYDGKSQEETSSDPPDSPGLTSDEVIYPETEQDGLLKCYKMLCTFQRISHNDKGEQVWGT